MLMRIFGQDSLFGEDLPADESDAENDEIEPEKVSAEKSQAEAIQQLSAVEKAIWQQDAQQDCANEGCSKKGDSDALTSEAWGPALQPAEEKFEEEISSAHSAVDALRVAGLLDWKPPSKDSVPA